MESRRRFLQITCCAIVLAMCAGNVYATPVVSLDTEAEWAAAVGTQISPLSPVEWAALDPDFHANVGTGVFVESTVWASGGGLYVYEETTLDLEPGLVNRTIGAKGGFDMPIAAPRARGDCQTWANARLR